MAQTRLGGCLRILITVVLAALVLGYLAAEVFLNLNSNVVARLVKDSGKALEVRLGSGEWRTLEDVGREELRGCLKKRHAEAGFNWSSFRVRRSAGVLGDAAQSLYGAEVNVVVLQPSAFEFAVSFKEGFEVTTAKERLRQGHGWFAINANFRDPKRRPMGWVIHEGRERNKPFGDWSGCFFVSDGKPYAGPKSLIEEAPGRITEGVQVYPSVMKNHTVFSYVKQKPDEYFNGSELSYRSLAGMRKEGSIVFVLSGDGGLMNVAEVADIAKKLDIQHATLMDGGRALQYSIRTTKGPWHFHAANTELPIDRHPLDRQQSPVFLLARRRAPEVISADTTGD
jgi:uncharacterized protein YigE (DUF2233 family)